jgi:HPt (histidine-containing phosphotransfer) domain-containing protein
MNYRNVETLEMADNVDCRSLTTEAPDYFDRGLLPELQMMFGRDEGEKEFWLLAEIFLTNLPQRLVNIKNAYDFEDWKTLHRLFHDLKSGSAYLGGKYLSRLADVLGRTVSEFGFSSDGATDFPGMLVEFEQECDRLQRHLVFQQQKVAQGGLD